MNPRSLSLASGWFLATLITVLSLPSLAMGQGALVNGTNHTGTIAGASEIHTWTFNAAAGDTIVVSMGEVQNLATLAPWVRLFNPSAGLVAEKFDLQVSQVTHTALQSGIYTVQVGSRDFNFNTTGIGDYRLTLAQVPGSFVVSSGDEGGAMTIGAEHLGTIVLGDLDMWTFTATAGDAIALSIGKIANSSLSPWIRLFNAAGAQVGSKFDLQASQISVTAAQTGTYTVVVGTSDFNAMTNGIGDYRLTVAKVPGAFAVSVGDQGGVMTNGAEHTGTIPMGDLDMWTFTATAGDAIALSVGEIVDGSPLSPWIRVFNPAGGQVGTKFDLQVSQINITAAQTGTYTVVVGSSDFNTLTNGTGDYRLTVATVPGAFVVSGGDQGGSMTNGAEHLGTIVMGDLDMWTFTATAGDVIALSIGEIANNATLAPSIRLFNPAGVQIGSKFDLQASQITVTAAQTGTFTVVVGSSDFNTIANGTGDYRLTVAKVPGAFVVSGGDHGGAMTAGVQHPGTIPMGDLDMWTFTANAGDAITVNAAEVVNGATLSPWIRVFNPAGGLVGQHFGLQTAQVIATAGVTGTYTVIVGTTDFNANTNGVGDYLVTVSGNNADWIVNGDFANGASSWLLFEVPDIVHNSAANGVFEYHKANPTSTTSKQAVIFQNTGRTVAAGTPLGAQFDIGNSDTVRKRITVLILDADFSDLSVCTFYLGPNAPLRTFQMKAHPTKAWTNAALYFYAASPGGGPSARYLLDNVSLRPDPVALPDRTNCVDPLAPAVVGGAPGPDLIVNGDFATGSLTPWGVFGDITSQFSGGVFEFIRPGTPGQPSGVILQPTGAAMAAAEVFTASFELGNSSNVRKRVTVLLHDLDFTDLTACTFWLAPGQALETYSMRSFATKAWTNATVSIYAATTGSQQWIRLDNVSMRRTPAIAALGTECIKETGNTLSARASGGASKSTIVIRSGDVSAATATAPVSGRSEAATPGPALTHVLEPVDLTMATSAQLSFESLLSDSRSAGLVGPAGQVQVSLDGVTWERLAVVPSGDDWLRIRIDLSAYAGAVIYLRFELTDGSFGTAAWRIDAVSIDISR